MSTFGDPVPYERVDGQPVCAGCRALLEGEPPTAHSLLDCLAQLNARIEDLEFEQGR